ncbi:hypothetical protein GCM10027521_63980 [Amycolatopsis cihanbeyliensis]
MIGAASALEPVGAHLRFVRSLATEARGPIRRDVVGLAGQWAQYAGWLHTAMAEWDKAASWFNRSLEWASEAEDADRWVCPAYSRRFARARTAGRA